jgi:hypothetical protein
MEPVPAMFDVRSVMSAGQTAVVVDNSIKLIKVVRRRAVCSMQFSEKRTKIQGTVSREQDDIG